MAGLTNDLHGTITPLCPLLHARSWRHWMTTPSPGLLRLLCCCTVSARLLWPRLPSCPVCCRTLALPLSAASTYSGAYTSIYPTISDALNLSISITNGYEGEHQQRAALGVPLATSLRPGPTASASASDSAWLPKVYLTRYPTSMDTIATSMRCNTDRPLPGALRATSLRLSSAFSLSALSSFSL